MVGLHMAAAPKCQAVFFMGKDLPGNDTYPFHVVRGADQDGRGEAQAFHHLSGFQCLDMGVFIIGRIIAPVNGRGHGYVKRGFDQFVVCHDQGAFEGRDQQKICISLFQQLPGLFSALRIVRSDEQDHGICMCRGFPAGQKRGRPQVGDGQTGKDGRYDQDCFNGELLRDIKNYGDTILNYSFLLFFYRVFVSYISETDPTLIHSGTSRSGWMLSTMKGYALSF
jgi:hypothetical protein